MLKRYLAIGLLFLLPMMARGQTAATATRPAAPRPPSIAGVRLHIPLDVDWRFYKGDMVDWVAAATDDATWQPVSIPHTWNAQDGQDGGGNYWKGTAWYHRHLTITSEMKGKTLYLRFEGASRRAEVFVNGQSVASHAGGFGAFCCDITAAIRLGDNIVTVKVSNVDDADLPPLSADFTFFGGIYRSVELLAVDTVHISPLDHASSGVYVETPEATEKEARVRVRAVVRYAAEGLVVAENAAPRAPATTRGRAPVSGRVGAAGSGRGTGTTRPAATAGAPDAVAAMGAAVRNILVRVRILDAAGRTVSDTTAPLVLAPGKTGEVLTALLVNRPHLWNARRDPYMYQVVVTLVDRGLILDEISQPLGIRTFSVDPAKGFILNGQPYDLHGVNRHQDVLDKGWAISRADQERDIALIKEMGCTAVRLAHYQHADYFYELCDKAGIVVWAEAALVNDITPGPAFAENCRTQLTDLIRQSSNHPSICFWSLSNEVFARNNARPLFTDLNALAHREDSSRLTTMAFRSGSRWDGITDVTGENRYFGWYEGTIADFAPWLATQPPRVAVSEYGAGASIYFHSEKPVRMDHTEEYQCLFHEAYWDVLKKNPQIWGKFVWCMFDFASDGRAEGDHAGRNDKGLVTYDRQVKKDAFYFYKANWSDEPTLYIASRRFTVRGTDKIAVKVYANVPEVTLSVNGTTLGKKMPNNGTVVWENVALNQGKNDIQATGPSPVSSTKPGAATKALIDSCTWTYAPGAPLEVYEAQDDVMRAALKAGPPRPQPGK